MSRWKDAARLFFARRAEDIQGTPTLNDLCWISGRDGRLWQDEALFDDLISSLADQLQINASHKLLEIGCASGFLARGIAPRVAEYVGIDVAEPALAVARRLEILNARFECGDATELPFPDGSFDRTFSYDVFTNFPEFASASRVAREAVRVTRPGGRVLIGSLADADRADEAALRIREVAEELEQHWGPPVLAPNPSWRQRLRRLGQRIEPGITCYEFHREDFVELGRDLDVATQILEIHPKNPYYGFRFNVVYEKPA